MKFKATQKEVKSNHSKVMPVSFCGMQELLCYEKPVAYTAGVYGWNADVYEVDGVAIVTGYRPFGNVKPDYDIIREYENKAGSIEFKIMPYEERREAVKALLSELVKKLINE